MSQRRLFAPRRLTAPQMALKRFVCFRSSECTFLQRVSERRSTQYVVPPNGPPVLVDNSQEEASRYAQIDSCVFFMNADSLV